jgi:hypothetical protein
MYAEDRRSQGINHGKRSGTKIGPASRKHWESQQDEKEGVREPRRVSLAAYKAKTLLSALAHLSNALSTPILRLARRRDPGWDVPSFTSQNAFHGSLRRMPATSRAID